MRLLLIVIVSRIEEAKETGPGHLFSTEFPKKLVGKMQKNFFFTYASPGSLKTLNRLCSNNSAFQVDRSVSEGFSAELARDRTW